MTFEDTYNPQGLRKDLQQPWPFLVQDWRMDLLTEVHAVDYMKDSMNGIMRVGLLSRFLTPVQPCSSRYALPDARPVSCLPG